MSNVKYPSIADAAAKKHPKGSIFNQFPAVGSMSLRSGATPLAPYHNYGADTMVIYGTMDTQWVKGKMDGPWEPVLDSAGKAYAMVWIVDYKDTNINPYKEFIIVFVVTHKDRPLKGEVKQVHDLLRLLDDKEAFAYIYKLWLDEQLPIDYGRELLGADKYMEKGMVIKNENGEFSFSCSHVRGERNSPATEMFIKGSIKLKEKMHLGKLVKAYGFSRTMGKASGATGMWQLVSPPGVMDHPKTKEFNPIWTIHYEMSPKFVEPNENDIEFGGELKESGFRSVLYLHDKQLKAVLLAPWTFVPVKQ